MKVDKEEEEKYGCNICGDIFQDLKSLKFHDATKHKSAVRVSRGPKKIEAKKILSQESCEAMSKKRKVATHPQSDICGVCRTSLSASQECPLCDEWGHENLLVDPEGGKSRPEEDSSPERRISLVRSNIRLNNIVGVLRNQVLGNNDVVPYLSAQPSQRPGTDQFRGLGLSVKVFLSFEIWKTRGIFLLSRTIPKFPGHAEKERVRAPAETMSLQSKNTLKPAETRCRCR